MFVLAEAVAGMRGPDPNADFAFLKSTTVNLSWQVTSETMEDIIRHCKQFLNYAATHQDAIMTYRKSDMVLVANSDASYLSEPKTRSRAGGHFFMSSDIDDPINNMAVLKHNSSRHLCPPLRRLS
jgi:hypothetical protein